MDFETNRSPKRPRREKKRERLKVLGRGSFGSAHLLSDSTVEKESVIGVVDTKMDTHDYSSRKSIFEREINILANLAHPNIIKFLGHKILTRDGRQTLLGT